MKTGILWEGESEKGQKIQTNSTVSNMISIASTLSVADFYLIPHLKFLLVTACFLQKISWPGMVVHACESLHTGGWNKGLMNPRLV